MSVTRRQVCSLSCFYVYSFFEFQGLRFHNTFLLTADWEVGGSGFSCAAGLASYFTDQVDALVCESCEAWIERQRLRGKLSDHQPTVRFNEHVLSKYA